MRIACLLAALHREMLHNNSKPTLSNLNFYFNFRNSLPQLDLYNTTPKILARTIDLQPPQLPHPQLKLPNTNINNHGRLRKRPPRRCAQPLGEVKLDYNLLATAIGSPTANAARLKWQRYQKKLKPKSNSPSPSKPTGVMKAGAGKANHRTLTKPKQKQVKGEGTSDEAIGTEEDQASICPQFQSI
jgi:hypothetical protein